MGIINKCKDIKFYLTSVDCEDGEVRLYEGETEWEGRLEMCYNRRWGTVSSGGWTDINTQVVCNDFGYDVSGKKKFIYTKCFSWYIHYDFIFLQIKRRVLITYDSHCQNQSTGTM